MLRSPAVVEKSDHQLIVTEDGSHSLNSGTFDVTYHSVHGAIQESRHVFMEAGLRPWLDAGERRINVLEMGFGTGLNAYLCLLAAADREDLEIHYLTVEKFPIGIATAGRLNFAAQLGRADDSAFQWLHAADWDISVPFSDRFTLQKVRADFRDVALPTDWAHCVFFDAFAPGSQPELWEHYTLKKAADALRQGGNLTTYCAKGVVKRTLKGLGLRIEALPGPPGKREMTRAVRDH